MAHSLARMIVAAGVLASVAVSHAQTVWYVDADAPPAGDGVEWATAFDDLQRAMELALPGDVIWVAEGVYVPSVIDPIAGEDQPYFLMPDGVAILGGFEGTETSADQRDPTRFESVISGDLLGNDLATPITGTFDSSPEMEALYQSKLDNTGTLLFVDNTGPGTVLDGLVFEHAYLDRASRTGDPSNETGVFVLGAILDIVGCTFRDNSGGTGGALYVAACGETAISPEFAAIHPCGTVRVAQPSAIVITDSLFEDNIDGFGRRGLNIGAAATFRDSVALIERTTVRFSSLPDIGTEFSQRVWGQPGFWFTGIGAARVSDSAFIRCSPQFSDIGVQASNGISALGAGTSTRLTEDVVLDIDGCTFIDNVAAPYGVVRFWGGTGSVRFSQFLGNRRYEGSQFAGGAAGVAIGAVASQFVRGDGIVVTDSAFVGNAALEVQEGDPSGRPIIASFFRQDLIERNTFVVNANNDVRVFTPGDASDETIIRDNLIAGETPALDPLFVRHPDDGGDGFGDDPATPDIDESLNDDYGDLQLRAGSPAIDAGSTFVDTDTILDLAGNDRYVDDPGIPGVLVDLGAYEFQGVTCLPDVNQDGMVSPADFNAWILAFNQGSPLADQNRDGQVSPADYNAWILNFNTGCP